MERHILRVLIAATIALFSVSASASTPEKNKPTFHDCTFLGHFGRIVLITYCPANTPPDEIATLVNVTKDPWLEKYGFVQYRIFSTKKGVPKNMNEIMAKSDAWFGKYELANALYNNRTGYKRFSCRKTPTAKISDCTNLLK